MGVVYLLHFSEKYHDHAGHYTGYTEEENLEKRIARHKSGNGARLIRAISKKGIGFTIVRTWKGVDKNFERKLKNHKNAKRMCPVCAGEKAYNRAKLAKSAEEIPF